VTLAVDYRIATPIKLHIHCEIRGFTALLGRSGAGKTTLLKALAGLLPAAGAPWAGLAPERRPVGYMPQGAALFPHLTALENAAYALRGPDRFARARALLDDLGIGALATRSAASLSGGEAQRVALARALGRGPELLLLDEPSAGLDGATRDAVMLALIETIDARGIPALAATHDPAVAGLADWLVLLAGGEIIQQGTPRAVFDQPVSVAAAELLGFQNIWEEGGGWYAIRAEDIGLTDTGLRATILSIREQGAGWRLECAAPRRVTVFLQAAPAALTAGETIHLDLPAAKVKRLLA